MPSPISRRPGGMLDLLLSQQQGQNPNDLKDDVQPGLDMFRFYAQDRLNTESVSKAWTAVTANTEISVPSGEAWVVYALGAYGTFATVNQYIELELFLIGRGDNGLIHNTGLQTPQGATDRFSDAFWLPDPIICPPGSRFRYVCTKLNLDAQANITTNNTCIYTRLEV